MVGAMSQASSSLCTTRRVQRQALRAYREGEQLCDAGRLEEGLRTLRAAYELAPELDGEWPEWAEVMYAETESPIALADARAHLVQPDVAQGRTGDDWLQPDALAAMREAMALRSFAVCDAFLDVPSTAALRRACAAAYTAGRMHPPQPPAATRQGGRKQGGDSIVWVGDAAADELGQALRELVERSDALVEALGASGERATDESAASGRRSAGCCRQQAREPPLITGQRCIDEGDASGQPASGACASGAGGSASSMDGLELAAPISSRKRPMVSHYGRGSAFARHIDSHAGDGRALSAVFYTSEGWEREDGGCLRIYKPACGGGAGAGAAAESSVNDAHAMADAGDDDDDDVVADIAPVAGRLLLFYSDERCPHEVLAVRSDAPRFAITLWYVANRAATDCSQPPAGARTGPVQSKKERTNPMPSHLPGLGWWEGGSS